MGLGAETAALWALSSAALGAGDNPVPHAVNHGFIETGSGWWIWSAHQGNLVISAIIMLVLGPWLAKKIGTGPESEGPDRYLTKNRFAHMIEVMCVYLRDEMVKPLLHDRTDRFMPFLWTLFFFILINNLLGMIPLIDLFKVLGTVGLYPESWHKNHLLPFGGTATQNIFVTGVLAFISFLVINGAGIKRLGVGGYFAHLTAGAPVYVAPLVVVIEALGVIIKPAALAIRLFANMTAGHILLATIFMFITMSLRTGLTVGAPVTALSAVAAIAISFLELFVAFLQAFIFMFLTVVFISLLDHHDEEHEHHAPEEPPVEDSPRAPHPVAA